jgi:hypothetical protein
VDSTEHGSARNRDGFSGLATRGAPDGEAAGPDADVGADAAPGAEHAGTASEAATITAAAKPTRLIDI